MTQSYADPNLAGYIEALRGLLVYYPEFDVAAGADQVDGIIGLNDVRHPSPNAEMQKVSTFFRNHFEYWSRLTRGAIWTVDDKMIISEFARATQQLAASEAPIMSNVTAVRAYPGEVRYRDILLALKYNFDTYDGIAHRDNLLDWMDLDKIASLPNASALLKQPDAFFDRNGTYLNRLGNGSRMFTPDDVDAELRSVEERLGLGPRGL